MHCKLPSLDIYTKYYIYTKKLYIAIVWTLVPEASAVLPIASRVAMVCKALGQFAVEQFTVGTVRRKKW